MPKIELRKAYFDGFSFSNGPGRGEGGVVVVSHWKAPWTDKHRESGGWEELPETVSGAIKLKPSRIAGTHLEFTPQGGMEKHAISMDIDGVDGCKVFVPTKEDGERELRFEVRTSVNKAEVDLGRLGRTTGKATGILKLSYDAEAQAKLAAGEDPDAAAKEEGQSNLGLESAE
jgi:hypothetical protein